MGKPTPRWSFRPDEYDMRAVEAELRRLRARHPEARLNRSHAIRSLIAKGEAVERDHDIGFARMLRAMEDRPHPAGSFSNGGGVPPA